MFDTKFLLLDNIHSVPDSSEVDTIFLFDEAYTLNDADLAFISQVSPLLSAQLGKHILLSSNAFVSPSQAHLSIFSNTIELICNIYLKTYFRLKYVLATHQDSNIVFPYSDLHLSPALFFDKLLSACGSCESVYVYIVKSLLPLFPNVHQTKSINSCSSAAQAIPIRNYINKHTYPSLFKHISSHTFYYFSKLLSRYSSTNGLFLELPGDQFFLHSLGMFFGNKFSVFRKPHVSNFPNYSYRNYLNSSFQFDFSQLCLDLPTSFLATLSSFVFNVFPAYLLESIEDNLKNFSDYLTIPKANILSSSLTNSHSLFLSYLSKLSFLDFHGMQHGGLYSYTYNFIRDIYEPSLVDTFYFRGLSSNNFLPSPRLSILNRHPIRFKLPSQATSVLYLSALQHRFDSISLYGNNTFDFIASFRSYHAQLISILCSVFPKVVEKLYSDITYRSCSEHYNELLLTLPGYSLYSRRQKGLSPNLVKNFSLLVWDHIGTGTIDCFVQGIPTIIYMPNTYHSLQVSSTIQQLIETGIICLSFHQLQSSLTLFSSSPQSWIQCTRRKQAIQAFLVDFSYPDPCFLSKWNQLLIN